MQNQLKVQIKRLSENAVIPSYAHAGDGGMDLTATSVKADEYGNYEYGTGLAIAVPEGYIGLIFPRSSICKTTLSLSNSVGIIDHGYSGEVKFKFKPTMKLPSGKPIDTMYRVGDRIGQLIIIPFPKVEFEEVKELSDTDRGEGGFGSSGK